MIGDDADRAGVAQRPGAGGEGCAGGEHVVDEEDAAGHLASACDPRRLADALRRGACRPGGRRRCGARQGSQRRAEALGQRGGHLAGRVEAPPRSRSGAAGTGTIVPLRQVSRGQPVDPLGDQLGDRQQPAELQRRDQSRATPSCGAEDQARSSPAGPCPASGAAAARRRPQRVQTTASAAAGAPAGRAERRDQAGGDSVEQLHGPILRAGGARVARCSSGKRQDLVTASGRRCRRSGSPRPAARRRRAGSTSRMQAPSPTRQPSPRIAGPSIRTPLAQLDPGADQDRAVDLGVAERARGADALRDLRRAGLDLDLPAQRVEVALRAAPRGCRCRSSRRRSRASRRARRPPAAPGRRPSPSRRSRPGRRGRPPCSSPGSGKKSKISERNM